MIILLEVNNQADPIRPDPNFITIIKHLQVYIDSEQPHNEIFFSPRMIYP